MNIVLLRGQDKRAHPKTTGALRPRGLHMGAYEPLGYTPVYKSTPETWPTTFIQNDKALPLVCSPLQVASPRRPKNIVANKTGIRDSELNHKAPKKKAQGPLHFKPTNKETHEPYAKA